MEETQKNQTKKGDILKLILIGLGVFIISALIFKTGMFIGAMKASFSYRWAEEYHRNFAGPRAGFFGFKPPLPGDFIESHGTFGEIIKIEGNTLIVKGRENIEKIVLLTEKTIIKSGLRDIKISDLKIGDMVVIIGSPNEQGQIEAKLIRVFPPKIIFKGLKFYE